MELSNTYLPTDISHLTSEPLQDYPHASTTYGKLRSLGEDPHPDGYYDLWVKQETFTIVPVNPNEPVLQQEILIKPNSEKGE